jgi:hypothetical protein
MKRLLLRQRHCPYGVAELMYDIVIESEIDKKQ